MNKKGDNYLIPGWTVLTFLVLFFLLFTFWLDQKETSDRYQQLQQKYNSLNQSYIQLQSRYDLLQQQYVSLQAEYDQFKQDTKSLLLGYVAKETLWEVSGFEKYRRLIEILGIILTGRPM